MKKLDLTIDEVDAIEAPLTFMDWVTLIGAGAGLVTIAVT